MVIFLIECCMLVDKNYDDYIDFDDDDTEDDDVDDDDNEEDDGDLAHRVSHVGPPSPSSLWWQPSPPKTCSKIEPRMSRNISTQDIHPKANGAQYFFSKKHPKYPPKQIDSRKNITDISTKTLTIPMKCLSKTGNKARLETGGTISAKKMAQDDKSIFLIWVKKKYVHCE